MTRPLDIPAYIQEDERRRQEEMARFERYWNAESLPSPHGSVYHEHDRPDEKIERLADQMEREDLSHYDSEGHVG